MSRWGPIVVALLLALAPAGAGAQSYRIYGAERYFSLEWAPGQYRGRPTVAGYVTNNYGVTADRVRVLVESLDGAGQVTATTIGYVNALVTPGTHAYFEVVVPARAAEYRVNVLSWDWRPGGPSG